MRSPLLWAGLLAILLYWFSVMPPGGSPGYAEDLCVADLSRQMMSEQIAEHGGPAFRSSSVMVPEGSSVPFMSWSMERDWLGAYVFRWAPEFPFLWVYYGLSLLVSFLAVGFILLRMGLGRSAAWGIALATVLIHVPRHFKIWHHFEHLPQHWIYLSLFVDAWIWQRVWQDRKWSLQLELWRGFFMLGMLGTSGYFWGPLVLEWVLLRGMIGLRFLILRRRGIRLALELPGRGWPVPVALALVWLVLDLRWLLPLVREAKTWGEVWQPIGWTADWPTVFRPLWAELIPGLTLRPIDWSETVVSVGWMLWAPALAGILILSRRRGLGRIAPFLAFFLAGFFYLRNWPQIFPYHSFIQSTVPFMKFFRAASRWGLFLPAILGVIIALSWPEVKQAWARSRTPLWRTLQILFVVSTLLELRWLAHPPNGSAAMPDSARSLLKGVAAQPGTTVLDLPFCVAGGNGWCTGEQCPNYPGSTMAECMRIWHGKKIYGLYQARMSPVQCENYNRVPFLSWFSAWREKRCFTAPEWDQFCDYLDSRPELSAVLLYPEVWSGGQPLECLAEFRARLGPPLAEARLSSSPQRGYGEAGLTRLEHYAPRCKR
ncbi:MAG TPA: hypothetical protein VM598_03240 [Bdellovibrionota bacterium]|nr:hypothetical protein [Bdellovibrionota bacterium]